MTNKNFTQSSDTRHQFADPQTREDLEGTQSLPKPADKKPQSDNAFDDPGYVESRNKALKIIPKTSLLSSLDRYAGSISMGLFTMAFGAIVAPGTAPLLIAGLLMGAVATAAVGIYAHYQVNKIHEPVRIERQEQHSIASSKMYGQHIAQALEKQGAGKTENEKLAPQEDRAAVPNEASSQKDWEQAVLLQKREREAKSGQLGP